MRMWMQDSEVSSQNWQETYVCNCVLWSTGDDTMEARFKCVLFFSGHGDLCSGASNHHEQDCWQT